jgi:hypothetical protein
MKNNYLDELEAAERRHQARIEEEHAERMEAFDRGLCSLGAAMEGGARYETELAESAQEITAEVAAPIAAALNGWMRGQRAARKAA